jgi:hypothetical protein
MEKEQISFQMEISILECISKENQMEKGYINGKMEVIMKEHSKKGLKQGLESGKNTFLVQNLIHPIQRLTNIQIVMQKGSFYTMKENI